MKVVVIETLDLEVVKLPFPVVFSFSKKRGVEENYWFTPNGVCKVYTGGLHTLQMGDIVDETYKTLMGQMKKTKCDILTNSYDFFTTGNTNIIKLNNMSSILYKIISEWNKRKDFEQWGNEEEGEEFILNLTKF